MKRIFFGIVFLVLIGGSVFGGGGWSSSGGEIFKFTKNPWFVKNSTDVDYCVAVDASSVSADEATVRDVVKQAFVYWKQEFDQPGLASTPGFAQIATQNFHEVPTCTPTTPIRFLFGYGMLSQEEVTFLVDPTKYVGISVRTDYDTALLKSRGFVYISSDFGPHAYDANEPVSHHLPRAWEKRTLLLYAVLHEMGHVFGVPHMGAGLMSEVFLDQLLHKNFYQFYLDNPVQSFINPPLGFMTCSTLGNFNVQYFQLPSDTQCLRFDGAKVGSRITWKVYARKSQTSPDVFAGTIQVDQLLQLQMGATPAVIVQLPSEQTVYSLKERNLNTFMLGPVFTEGTASGNFQTATSHRPNDLQVELRTDSVVMTGLVGGRMTPVMVYRPPSLLNIVFPTPGS